MAMKTLVLAALLVAALALATAPEHTHALGSMCSMSYDEYMTCSPAAATENPTPQPSADCCAALKKADLTCLCSYKDSSMLSWYNIDGQRAMELPAKCGLTKPANC